MRDLSWKELLDLPKMEGDFVAVEFHSYWDDLIGAVMVELGRDESVPLVDVFRVFYEKGVLRILWSGCQVRRSLVQMCNRLLHDAGVRRPADQEAWYQGLHVTMPASEGSTLTDLNHQATGLWIEDCATQLTTGMPGNAVQQRSTQSMSTLICNAAEKTLVIHDRAVLKADELDGFPPEEVTRIRSGLLLMHASENRVAEVRALVEVHGLDLSVQDTGGLTALHHACQKGNVDVARYILERSDKHIHERDKHGNTPLHAASRTQQIEVVQLLLAKKPLLDAVNQAGLTPLVAAKQVGYTTMVQLLRAAGASWA